MIPGSMDDFVHTSFAHDGKTKPLFRKGEGPGVVVVHEIPGITPEVADFARKVADRGFTVFLPELFGVTGQPKGPGNIGREIVRSCISREFTVLARRGSSPVTIWLRALCRHAHAACGGPGVGAIGMCLTGNFALSLMVDDSVMAPVLSQPSLPFGVTPSHAAALAVSDEELAVIKRRTAEGVTVLGLRFTHDLSCPGARFRTLERELGDGFEGIEVPSGPGNPWGIPRYAHSVVTNDLVDEEGHPTLAALDRVLALFEERLRA
jgi:dienelactone hydrolase